MQKTPRCPRHYNEVKQTGVMEGRVDDGEEREAHGENAGHQVPQPTKEAPEGQDPGTAGEEEMIFRPTQKLSAKIKAGTLNTLPLDENPFADWSAHLFLAARTQYILVTNT